MVATRSHKPKEEEAAPDATAGGGIKAPARRGRAKKAEPDLQEEEKPETTTKKAAPKSHGKAAAKKESEWEPEVEAQEVVEEPPKVEPKKPAPRGRAKAASKPEPEPEIKVTKRSTRAAAPPAASETTTKTRKTSQTKTKADTTAKKTVKKAESEEKPKGRGRKPSASKKPTKVEDEKHLPTVIETPAEGEEVTAPIEGGKETEQAQAAIQQVAPPPSTTHSPAMPQSSQIPLPSAPSQPDLPSKSTGATNEPASPIRSAIKNSALKLSTTVNSFRSSVLSSPEKSLGSPRKPPVPPRMLNSPPKSRTGSPFRISHMEAPSVRKFNIQSPFKPPMLRPVSSESQLSLSVRKQALFAPNIAPRPSTSSGPSTNASPTKSSMRVAGTLSPKKSVTFNHHTPEKIEARAPATPKATTSQAQSVGPTAVEALPPPTPKPQIFTGLTFYVDVRDHRTGAEASMLFTPLLIDLGATVIPTWSSNANAVTHVLFKDGDLMTLEKVVASAGAVKAVNIGYPLDCEREGKMLDESGYLIDLPSVQGLETPGKHSHGGTPRSVKMKSAAATPAQVQKTPAREVMGEIEFPTIAGLRIKTPSFAASKGAATATTPFVPSASAMALVGVEEDKENVTPVPTPLLQKSCPAKQEQKPLFAVNVGEREEMTPVKKRVLGTKRRETMMPKFG